MEWYLKAFNELSVEELYKIIQQRIQVFVVEQNCSYLDCDDKDVKAQHLYGMEGNQIVAYVRILPPEVSYQEASIGRVLVHQEFRNRGIASELMKRAIDYVENEWHESAIRISAQTYLLDFYGQLGFKATSEIYKEDGLPHIEMLYLSQP